MVDYDYEERKIYKIKSEITYSFIKHTASVYFVRDYG
jgi:hypothetical protein